MGSKESKSFSKCRKITIVLALLGIGLSYYSIFVSNSKSKDPNYVALCDISSLISCSDVLTSYYSKGFGFIGKILGENNPLYQSNGYYGLFFYSSFLITSLPPVKFIAKVQLVMSIGSLFISVYLGWILYLLQELCLVCATTYLINLLLFIVSLKNFISIKNMKRDDYQNSQNDGNFFSRKPIPSSTTTIKKRV